MEQARVTALLARQGRAPGRKMATTAGCPNQSKAVPALAALERQSRSRERAALQWHLERRFVNPFGADDRWLIPRPGGARRDQLSNGLDLDYCSPWE